MEGTGSEKTTIFTWWPDQLTEVATHASTVLPVALASVPFGCVLVRVRVWWPEHLTEEDDQGSPFRLRRLTHRV